ncbi:NRPS-like enzyme [Penicillium paradoxum]|uniref:NRPS-like enzyme n=1 Tax=Penicillium paradoxum TaxID=176176 RepID=UPI002549284B|nr:NRPS-like enzyme [Penicillium paradoxum]KAJ5794970.1 NRPS-like enzyme [Penicillium paradoxum]
MIQRFSSFCRTGEKQTRKAIDRQIDYVGRQDYEASELKAVTAAILQTSQSLEAVVWKVKPNQRAGSILMELAVPRSSTPHAIEDGLVPFPEVLPEYRILRIELISQLPIKSHANMDRKQLSRPYGNRRVMKQIPVPNDYTVTSEPHPCSSHFASVSFTINLVSTPGESAVVVQSACGNGQKKRNYP